MPGFLGFCSDHDNHISLESMSASMNHRSYRSFAFKTHNFSIGYLSAASVDSGIHHSCDKSLSLTIQGELFSLSEELSRNSDPTENLLSLLESEGLEILKRVNGQFSACLHDHKKAATYLITDRLGTHPVYFKKSNGALIFASEVKAIMQASRSRNVDLRSIAELFSLGHLFGEKTMFEDISMLPPASILKYHQGVISVSTYWTFPYDERSYYPQQITRNRTACLAEQLENILDRAIRRQSLGVEHLVVPLSGGLDSRYVAALYHRIGKRDLATFTFGPNSSEDQSYGSQVASRLNFQHYKFEILPGQSWQAARTFAFVGDGMYNIAGPLQTLVSAEYFANKKKILATSQMCDALFGNTLSHKRVRRLRDPKTQRHISDSTLVDLFRIYDQDQIKKLFRPETHNQIRGLYRDVPSRYCTSEFHPLHNYFRLLMNEHGRRGTLGGNVVTNMFFSTRMLSYDNEVFDFGFSLPIDYREHQYLYRRAFANMFPDLAQIRRQGFNLKVSASNTRYKLKILENKVGALAMNSRFRSIARLYKPWTRPSYVNYPEWFRKDLREELTSFLTKKELLCSQMINPAYVKILLDDHLSEKRNNASLLWQVVNLEYFFQNFLD